MILYLLFFVIALIYSSVGFGGGSSYLALLYQTTLPVMGIKFLALSCNLIVVSVTLIKMRRKIGKQSSLSVMLILAALPMAFLGGHIVLDRFWFKVLAAVFLLLSGFMLLSDHKKNLHFKLRDEVLVVLGSLIAFVSGLIGIGGGIFLSPLLYITGKEKQLNIPLFSSIYIFLNSLMALMGLVFNSLNPIHGIMESNYAWLPLMVLMGTLAGNYYFRAILSLKRIKQLTAILVLWVGFNLMKSIIF